MRKEANRILPGEQSSHYKHHILAKLKEAVHMEKSRKYP